MKNKILFCITFLFLFLQANSQNKWGTGSNYITHDGKDIFLNGVNYVPPYNWMMNIEIWDEKQIEKDMAGIEAIGVKCVRFFPFWHLTQPTPNRLDEKIMKHIDRVLEIGAKHHLSFQIALFTGWMSGATFLPDWAMGNIFTDKNIIKGQKFLAREFAKRYKNNSAVQCFDFGNEINVLPGMMKLQITPEEMDQWMQTIYKAFKEGDPNCVVTNGIGTGFDPLFNIEAISKSCDYMSLHCYPGFHGVSRFDPQIGQRTLYCENFITEWTAMMKKPVLVQENSARGVGALHVFYISSWAEGAAGYFWWGSHFIDPKYKIVSKAFRKDFSNQNAEDLRGDKTMGLLTTENVPNDRGLAYKECTEWIDKLGVGWVDQLPVCYILIPHTTAFYDMMRRYVTPFTLAKQAHFDVKICWEDKTIPDDASCVVIPGFQLSGPGKKTLNDYLNKGGVVFQSYYSDLSPDIVPTGKPDIILDSLSVFVPQPGVETFYLKAIQIKKAILRDVTINASNVTTLSSPVYGASSGNNVKDVFVRTKVGKGYYYYLRSNVEESLWEVFNPWAADDSYLFYTALRPSTKYMIDNRYVEFYHKKRGNEELLVLINHENSVQDVILSSKEPVNLENAISNNPVGTQTSFCFRLKPAEVLFFKVRR
jgi:hypothetical protein